MLELADDTLDVEQNASGWLLIPPVDELVRAEVRLAAEECYSYAQLPILGGDYTVANIRVVPLAQHY